MRKSIPFLFVLFFSCTSIDIDHLSQDELLELAFQNDSEDLLMMFFESWESQKQKYNNLHIADSNLVANLNKIVLKIYGDPGSQYRIFHEQLKFVVSDSLVSSVFIHQSLSGKYLTRDDILSVYKTNSGFFSPEILNHKFMLPLTENYKAILKNYLAKSPMNDGGYGSKRLYLITRSATYLSGMKKPSIGLIQINSNFTKALVSAHFSYYFSYWGLEYTLEKVNGEWLVVNERTTGMS